jgi:hypothetical protein
MKLVWGFMLIQQLEENLPNFKGWMNQYIAATADTVVLMVSGIPVTIKDKNKIVMILHHGIHRK